MVDVATGSPSKVNVPSCLARLTEESKETIILIEKLYVSQKLASAKIQESIKEMKGYIV